MKSPSLALRKFDASLASHDALILPIFKEHLKKNAVTFSPALQKVLGAERLSVLADFARRRGFKANKKQTLYFPSESGRLILLMGLGGKKKFELDVLRQASARALKIMEHFRVAKYGLVLAGDFNKTTPAQLVETAALGTLLGSYEFDKYKTPPKDKFSASLTEIIIERLNKTVQRALVEAEMTAEVVNETRDLQNDNADDVNPQSFALAAKKAAQKYRLKMTVLEEAALKKQGLNLLRAVGRASKWPPRLVILEYHGDKSRKKNVTALVGKGVTFDTGGVNLKPSEGGMLSEMHMDMSGAATVLGVLKLASLLKLKVNLVGAMPVAENALGGNAIKPGSVVRAANGKTVEIANTDAEGRLILADALAYLTKEFTPARVIDLATLTGSIISALSFYYAGLVANSDKLSRGLLEAGRVTAEKLWPLPLDDDYRKSMRGTKSDLTNVSKKGGDAIKAAAFLENFTDKTPWAHIDIAGTAMPPDARGYNPAGGTGFGVRLLIEYLRNEPTFK